MTQPDAIANLHSEIEASGLHPIAKNFLRGLRRGSDGFEMPRQVATTLVDELYAYAKSGKNLGPILQALLYFAKGYETELNSPMVGIDLGQAINDLSERLRAMSAEEAQTQRARNTVLGNAPAPKRESAPQDNALPSFKPWEILRKK